MIRQDDKRFNNQFIISEGCAFMSVLYWVNKYKNISLDPATIEVYFNWMKENACFTSDNLIIWQNAFRFLGLPIVYEKNMPDADFYIYNWHNPRTGHYHFTPGANGIALFDPLGFSVTVREGHIHSTRGFKLL